MTFVTFTFLLFFIETFLENVINVFQNHMKQTWIQRVHFCQLGTCFKLDLKDFHFSFSWTLLYVLDSWMSIGVYVLLGLPFIVCMYWVGLEHKVQFIAGYCTQCENLLKLELFMEEKRVQRWRIMGKLVRGCAFLPKYRLACRFLSFLSVYIQIVCSIPLLFFHLSLKGRVFSLSKAVLFAGELWHVVLDG